MQNSLAGRDCSHGQDLVAAEQPPVSTPGSHTPPRSPLASCDMPHHTSADGPCVQRSDEDRGTLSG
jgi:hypothetical protein